MAASPTPDRYVCSDCGKRSSERGACDACGEGPVVDTDDPEALAVLRDLDRGASDRRRRHATMIAVPSGMVLGAGLATVVPTMLPIPFGAPLQAVLFMALVAFGVLKALQVAWPAPQKFTFLEGEITASVRGEVGAMQMAETRRPLMILAGFVVVGIGIGGFAYFQKRAAADAKLATEARAAQAWADMQQCLLGAKLRDVPSPPAQVRRIALAGNDPKQEGAWPTVCAAHVTTLYEALDDRDFGPAVKQELRDRFACDEACNPNDPGVQLPGLHDLVAAAGIADVAPTVTGPSMVTDQFISKEEVRQIAPGDARIRDRDYLADGRGRYLFNSRGAGLSFCEISPDSEEAAACEGLSLRVSPATVTLVPQLETLVVAGRAGSLDAARHFDASGSAVKLHQGKRHGFVATVKDDRKVLVESVANGEVTAERTLKMRKGASRPTLIDDVLFYTAPKDDKSTLFALKLTTEGDGDEAKIKTKRREVGAADALRGAPEVCRSGETRALLFGRSAQTWSLAFVGPDGFSGLVSVGKAQKKRLAAKKKTKKKKKREKPEPKSAGSANNARAAALRDAAEYGMMGLLDEGLGGPDPRWGLSAPTGLGAPSLSKRERDMWGEDLSFGERARRAPLPRYAFTCGGETATLTWRSPSQEQQLIHQVKCSADGCTHDTLELDGIDVKTWWTAATVVADDGSDKVLLVWRDPRGLLRRRTAPLAELQDAQDVLVMDSAEFGGPTTLDLEAVYGNTAVVFVFRGKGFHALRFGADGTTRSL